MTEDLPNIGVEKVTEHEDGSATYMFEMDDKAVKLVQEVGLQFIMYCGASGVDIQQALDMILEKGQDDVQKE